MYIVFITMIVILVGINQKFHGFLKFCTLKCINDNVHMYVRTWVVLIVITSTPNNYDAGIRSYNCWNTCKLYGSYWSSDLFGNLADSI